MKEARTSEAGSEATRAAAPTRVPTVAWVSTMILWALGGFAVAVTAAGCGSSDEGARAQTRETETQEPAPDPEPEFDTLVERGRWLYRERGCFACHGENGVGGVENENYVGGTVPALNQEADRMGLFEPEDAEAFIAMMEEGVDPATRAEDPPFPGYARFLAQYQAMLTVINEGATPGRRDPNGVEPPLQMPAWGEILSDQDKRAIFAYLVSLYDYDAEEPVVDDEEEPEEALEEVSGPAGSSATAPERT